MYRKLFVGLVIASLLLAGLWLALGGSVLSQPAQDDALLAGYTFTGHVYEGYKPSASTPLNGVSVGLWGDADEWPEGGSARVQLATATTNSSGVFSLSWTPGGTFYYYLHVIEIDPTGYWSTGAEPGSSPGYVKNYNCISYYSRYLEQNTTYSGIGFWDARNATPTATRTTQPRYTPTPTATRPSGNTPTITATSTKPSGPTPTFTRTPQQPYPPPPTATSTEACPPLSLSIEKKLVSHPSGVAAIGDTLTFIITLTNTSATGVPAASIRDTYPTAYFELVPGQSFNGWGTTGAEEWVEWTSYGPGNAGFGPGNAMVVPLQLKAIAQGSAADALNMAEGTLAPYYPCQGPSMTTTLGVEIGCAPLSLTLEKKLVSHPSGVAYVGDTLTFVITMTNTSAVTVTSAMIIDRFPTAYFALAPGQSFSSVQFLPGEVLITNLYGGILLGPGDYEVLPLQLIAHSPADATEAVNRAWGLLIVPNCPLPIASAEAGVTIRRSEGDVHVRKFLVDPASGIGAIGDIARFRIHVENVGNAPATFNVEDTFADADFDFVGSMPPPTVNASDGITHLLRWENLTLPPSGVLDIIVDLRMKQPGVLVNCAHYDTIFPTAPTIAGLLGPDSCAEVRVPSTSEHDIAVYKYFTSPTNHLASVGDKLSFETGMKTLGPGAIESFSVHDYFVPQSIGNPGDSWLDYTWSMGPPTMFAPGFVASVMGSAGPVVGTAYPAWNIAEWTATWPDGFKITKTAMDYVVISEQQSADGLVIRKERLGPPGVTVSDTVEFRITIVNVSGALLPVTPLSDSFDPNCLRFLGAFPPPDTLTPIPGGISAIWNNLGALLPGQSISVIVRFHAESPCLATLNCAGTQDVRQNGAIAVDCLPLDIAGPRPVLKISKIRLTPSPAMVGDLVEYRIHLQNAGVVDIPSPLPLTDQYDPAFLVFDSSVPMPDSVNLPMGLVQWNNVGPLLAGQGKDIIVRLRAIRPGVKVRNCASAVLLMAGVSLPVEDCAPVDIQAHGPAARITKERTIPSTDAPVGVGEVVVFKITVVNVGGVPLNPLRVDDNFDPHCLEFLSGSIPPVLIPPGHVVWDLPALPPGGSVSWEIVLRTLNPCGEVANCVHVIGYGPDGLPTEDAACAPVRIVPPEPGVRVNKYIKLLDMPVVGDVVQFRINVGNTGNTTLVSVPLVDHFNPNCFEFVSALPAPDAVNPLTGEIIWNNLGPLAPGGVANLRVWLRVKSPCSPSANCASVRATDAFGRVVESRDCADIYTLSAGPRAIYLPLLLKQFPR
jgi:uncharacterized repeat protein (TIGR01451 family)